MPDHPPRRRGRPTKFGRPSEVVAITLPAEVVSGLKRVHQDIGWAIVRLFERHTAASHSPQWNEQRQDAELVTIGGRRSLIAVKADVVTNLPGVQTIPLDQARAFLALEPGHGMSDLELAVVDRLEDERVAGPERDGLVSLRGLLKQCRQDPHLAIQVRGIIVVEHRQQKAGGKPQRTQRRV